MSPNSAHARMAYQPGVGSEVRIPVMLAGMRMAHVPRLVAKGTCDEAQSEEDTVRRYSGPERERRPQFRCGHRRGSYGRVNHVISTRPRAVVPIHHFLPGGTGLSI
jgi:hypothetical protein